MADTALVSIICEDYAGLIAEVTGHLFDLGVNLGDTTFAVLGGAAEFTSVCELTPGIESPTVSPLHDQGWVAVRAMVPRRDTHRVMDELWELGARGILVTDIHACRI